MNGSSTSEFCFKREKPAAGRLFKQELTEVAREQLL